MMQRVPTLNQALEELVLHYAQERLRDEKIPLSDLHEAAVADAIDMALASLFRRVGLPSYCPSKATTVLVSKRLEEALELTLSDSSGVSRIAAALGDTFEVIRGQRLALNPEKNLQLETSPERRGKGVYFTPAKLAEAIVTPALSHVLRDVNCVQDLRGIHIVDPAAGCGAFLLAVIRVASSMLAPREGFAHMSAAELRAEIASSVIFGVDIDPIAIAISRALIRAEVGLPEWNGTELDRHLHVGDAISTSLSDWTTWFPAALPVGFSLVVTNPPWSKLRPLRHEYFEHVDKQVRLYQGTELGRYLDTHLNELVEGEWSAYANRTLELSRRLKKSKEYKINATSSGDPDLYKYFIERSLDLIAPHGIASLLLPSGLLRAQGSAGLRGLLLSSGKITHLVEYINKQKLFDIHSMYRFCTLIFQKGSSGGIAKAIFGEEQVSESPSRQPISLSPAFLKKTGGHDRLIPEVRSKDERTLLEHLFAKFPTVGSGLSNWAFSFKRELDMTNDADAFIAVDVAQREGYIMRQDGAWRSEENHATLIPVYEGRMVHQFDHAAKVYLSGQGRSASWAVPNVDQRVVIPHYLVTEEYARARGWTPTPKVGYCEISGHANERTLLAALLPAQSICGNKVPVLRLENDSIEAQLVWLCFANSLVVDWIMRRFVSTTVNHFYWKNVPLPYRGLNSQIEEILTKAAWMLSYREEKITDIMEWLGNRALLRAVIDVAVMELYGIADEELNILLDDFPQFRNAYLRGPTGSMSLKDLLSKTSQAFRSGNLDLKTLSSSIGCSAEAAAAAYVPKEQAKLIKKTLFLSNK